MQKTVSDPALSQHFVKRLKYFGTEYTVVRDFVKVTLAVDTESRAIVSRDVVDSHNVGIRRFAPVLESAKIRA